jgi:selenide,water dikinase
VGPEALAQVLRPLAELFDAADHPDLLAGLHQADDAAVLRLDDERALVLTTDFFTPIVDDPYAFGTIAAANSLSDVYAMGARPLLCLNVMALPEDLPTETQQAILRGGAETVRRAGAVLAGGHSIKDAEPKYGLVALGMAHPDRLLKKAGARPGDHLLLTKKLGTGTVTTALKSDRARSEWVEAATAEMSRLNRAASEAALACGARSATDITGFGLAGHALEMALASGVAFRLRFSALPLLPGAAELAEADVFPGGAHDNRRAYRAEVEIGEGVDSGRSMLLFDPQTSGGLLVAVPPEGLALFHRTLEEAGESCSEIGEAVEGPASILVEP